MLEIEKIQEKRTVLLQLDAHKETHGKINTESNPHLKELTNKYEYFIADNPETEKKENNDLKVGDKFYGQISTFVDGKTKKLTDVFEVISTNKVSKSGTKSITIKNSDGKEFKTSTRSIQQKDIKEEIEKEKQKSEIKEMRKTEESLKVDFDKLSNEDQILATINAEINNIWMVGPAGCGKSTMARNIATKLNLPYLCISCGIGTSATEFVGYKYPSREATKFAEYYNKPSIILIDEMTALDPAVAQVLNAALANNEIETTTGTIKRNEQCIIIATSNTFGNGANRQYVANNQLDASTIDRFVGGIIEVDYSVEFERKYDKEVVIYVTMLRRIIKQNDIRRIASTRMIQAGHSMKQFHFKNWKEQLIVNWTDTEKKIVQDFIKSDNPFAFQPKKLAA